MSGGDLLPKFRRPPVTEVAVGVQFAAPGFLPTHYGALHERLKHDFPNVEVLPPIPPVFEVLPASPPQNHPGAHPPIAMGVPGMSIGPPWPRVLLISADDCSLIQVQSDRLYFNWRQRPQQEYLHYRHVRDGFSRAYSTFEALAADQGFSPIVPTQCEVLYVNPLPVSVTGADPSSPEKVFRVWNPGMGKEWGEPLDDLSFNARYPLRDAAGERFGRLTASMSTLPGAENAPLMRLELVARGLPRGPGRDGILAFHDSGHEAIIRCFAAITTQDMHNRWGREQ